MRAVTDFREYGFVIVIARIEAGQWNIANARYLGTGFFVSAFGDAVTAAHVLRAGEGLQSDERVVAITVVDGKERVSRLTEAIWLNEPDVAVFRLDLERTKCFDISMQPVHPGMDVSVVGFPSHRVSGEGFEMRVLKGHVTGCYQCLELNFAIPAGMSGAPVFLGSEVIGYATGRVRSEEIEEQTEELVEVGPNNREKIVLRTTSSITYYGLARSFWSLTKYRHPELGNLTIPEIIERRKARR